MSKDSAPEKWVMAPHTKAKHQILNDYLGAWYPILSNGRGRVLYIDGFAGRGRYGDGSDGSPQIALRRLLTHDSFPQMSQCEFMFMFIEKDKDNCTALEGELEAMRSEYEKEKPWPSNVHPHVINGSFDTEMTELFRIVREQNKQLAPTFAFVDPFGYTRFPMDLLAQIAATPNSELFINFMVGFVQRFITRDHQEAAISALYGRAVDDVLVGLEEGHDRIDHLVDVYADALAEKTNLPYIQRFYMLNRTGNVSYALLHATKNRLGVKRMKAAMWKVDPGGNYRLADRTHGEAVLFEPEPNLARLEAIIIANFTGHSGVTKDDVQWFTVLETAFRETHATPLLKKMEGDGTIVVHRPPGKRGFPAGVTFDFV
ncbi:three-Cys-motif partner protein TcmP [Rhodococcus sp. WB9]|uniref:three-Cys-motif partner protein TcmP n=1 Tax=Rhodococcus sp. WB9 TaxID=2594007 RepID=UPI0016430BF8|nr:three-Cys-motif partner protein TcmP [Rhodococcus sp. WB9]